MIKIAICDDIPHMAAVVKKILDSHDFGEKLEIDNFENGLDFYKESQKKKYDIIMTDIELTPEGYSKDLTKNGMFLADKVKEASPETIVIFFSRFHYERDLLSHEPFGFVDKPNPESDGRMIELIEKAIRRIKNRVEYETTFWFKKVRVSYGIAIKDILFFESKRPRIKVLTIHEECNFRGQLDQVQENIEKGSEHFIRVSKSHYINMRYIKSFSLKEITMTNEEIIPITRKYMEDFRKKSGDLC